MGYSKRKFPKILQTVDNKFTGGRLLKVSDNEDGGFTFFIHFNMTETNRKIAAEFSEKEPWQMDSNDNDLDFELSFAASFSGRKQQYIDAFVNWELEKINLDGNETIVGGIIKEWFNPIKDCR